MIEQGSMTAPTQSSAKFSGSRKKVESEDFLSDLFHQRRHQKEKRPNSQVRRKPPTEETEEAVLDSNGGDRAKHIATSTFLHDASANNVSWSRHRGACKPSDDSRTKMQRRGVNNSQF
mmetsp:Transcript_58845/g.137868  ORF Transcript_58845/g.137868 Transcript_58845/m.137868 type:complete len:118 (-) Transcript_58845:683-1036(-)